MKILCDRHHGSLTESLVLLFQKRLGWDIYFQKGMEWYPEFWNIYPHVDTAKQYLERELEGWPGITLEEFKNTKFDVLLCSIPQHVEMFIRLRDLYQPQAKLIFQVGNMWAFDNKFPIKNIMASAVIPNLPTFNTITYHQEFDLNIFYPSPVSNPKKIYSFINCINTEELYKDDWALFLELERLLPDWEFKSFGGQCRDGGIWDRRELADKMREATFIYQVKKNGDGYGHNIFSAAAVGRPIITRQSDYKGKLAETLIADLDTAICVDYTTPQSIAGTILKSDPIFMSAAMAITFDIAVDFDAEEQKLREFLANLI